MTSEQMRKLILDHFTALNEGRYEDAISDYLAEDATWWTAGTYEGYTTAPRSKAEMLEMFRQMPAFFPKGYRITADRFVIDGDWAAVEAHAFAPVTAAQKTYQQQYRFLFEVKDGKLHTVKEYLDTQHVAQALMGQ